MRRAMVYRISAEVIQWFQKFVVNESSFCISVNGPYRTADIKLLGTRI